MVSRDNVNTYNYDKLIDDAKRFIVFKQIMSHVVNHGLSGGHYFVIGFLTQYPNVQLPDFMLEKFPDEMHIALKDQFYNLRVLDDRFSVDLNFNESISKISIPFSALTVLYDPFVDYTMDFIRPIFIKNDRETNNDNDDNVFYLDKFKR